MPVFTVRLNNPGKSSTTLSVPLDANTTVLVLAVNVPALESQLPSIVMVAAAAVNVPPACMVNEFSCHVPAPVTVTVAVGTPELIVMTPPSMPPVPEVMVPPSWVIVPVFQLVA